MQHSIGSTEGKSKHITASVDLSLEITVVLITYYFVKVRAKLEDVRNLSERNCVEHSVYYAASLSVLFVYFFATTFMFFSVSYFNLRCPCPE